MIDDWMLERGPRFPHVWLFLDFLIPLQPPLSYLLRIMCFYDVARANERTNKKDQTME